MCRQLPPGGASRLERVILDRYHAGNIDPGDARRLFDELLQQAEPASIRAINCLLTVIARGGPARAVSLFNRLAGVGAGMVVPDACTYGIVIHSSAAAATRANRTSPSLRSDRSSRRDGGRKLSPFIN
jgi:hypothetical protein